MGDTQPGLPATDGLKKLGVGSIIYISNNKWDATMLALAALSNQTLRASHWTRAACQRVWRVLLLPTATVLWAHGM